MALLYLLAGARPAAGSAALSGSVAATAAEVGAVADGITVRGWTSTRRRGREGAAEVVVGTGGSSGSRWLDGRRRATAWTPDGVLIVPGFVDLHAHFREPGNEDAETVATGRHGGRPRRVHDGLPDAQHDARDRRAGRGRPSRGRGRRVGVAGPGRSSTARSPRAAAARRWPRSASWPMPASSGFSRRRRAGAERRRSCGNALAYAGALGLPIVDHPEDPTLTEGAEASEGYVATCSASRAGRSPRSRRRSRGRSRSLQMSSARCPARGSTSRTSRRAAALAHVRAAKAAGLPVTCDVTPHHLALTDEWIAGVAALVVGRARRGWLRP